jgi:hypothetical protein
MILPATAGDGRLVFSNVPKGEKAIITGVGSAEGKLFFAKHDVITGENAIKLDMKETPIATINEQLAVFKMTKSGQIYEKAGNSSRIFNLVILP